MSQMTDFTLSSCVPGRTLHAFRCVPEGEVRAILQLSHGMVEFIDRYKPLAEYLAARGILVTGHDHLGHGGSIRTKADYGYFAQPDGNRAVLDDLHAVTALTKQLYPGVPYFLLGHSMGSFYARQYLCEWGDELDGAIIMGTGFQPKALSPQPGRSAGCWPSFSAGSTAASWWRTSPSSATTGASRAARLRTGSTVTRPKWTSTAPTSAACSPSP